VAGALAILIFTVSSSAGPEVPAGITAAQRSAATKQQLELHWSMLTTGENVLQPTTPIVRYTTYLDAGPTEASCLTRGGYPAKWSAQFGLVVSPVPVELRRAFDLVDQLCDARYPEDPAELGFLSAPQEAFLLSYWQTSLIPCLRGEGVRVKALPPVGAYGEGDEAVGPGIDPYQHVVSAPKGTILTLLYGRCPPYPSVLFGASKPTQ
jgi:hypothetical protein